MSARFIVTLPAKNNRERNLQVFVPVDGFASPKYEVKTDVSRDGGSDQTAVKFLITKKESVHWDRFIMEKTVGIALPCRATLHDKVVDHLYDGRVIHLKTLRGWATIGRRCVAIPDGGPDFEIYGAGMDFIGSADEVSRKILTTSPYLRALVAVEVRRIAQKG